MILLEQALQIVGRFGGPELFVKRVSLGGFVAERPGEIGPAIKNPTSIQQDRVKDKLVAQENIGGFRVIEQPCSEATAIKWNIDNRVVMNPKPLDRTTKADRDCEHDRDGFTSGTCSPNSP